MVRSKVFYFCFIVDSVRLSEWKIGAKVYDLRVEGLEASLKGMASKLPAWCIAGICICFFCVVADKIAMKFIDGMDLEDVLGRYTEDLEVLAEHHLADKTKFDILTGNVSLTGSFFSYHYELEDFYP